MRCKSCNIEGPWSRSLPYCPSCIRNDYQALASDILEVHKRIKRKYNLPETIPHHHGVKCSFCVNDCSLAKGEPGYCGMRRNIDGTIEGPDKTWAYLSWYHDPLPTNCVADWVCLGSHNHGYNNLAVFYQGCTFNCLFCQNWHYRDLQTRVTTEELVRAADPVTGCICFFGGDPTPFALHSCEIARLVLARRRKMRICWETNGSASTGIMKRWIDYALKSDGCIKIDFKTFSENLNLALCGASNKYTKDNIQLVARAMPQREKPPLLIVSTLLIPGYIDEHELTGMAQFLSSIDKSIPWTFLGFHPHFSFGDMPRTSRTQADAALAIAEAHGIENTHVGNIHLLV